MSCRLGPLSGDLPILSNSVSLRTLVCPDAYFWNASAIVRASWKVDAGKLRTARERAASAPPSLLRAGFFGSFFADFFRPFLAAFFLVGAVFGVGTASVCAPSEGPSFSAIDELRLPFERLQPNSISELLANKISLRRPISKFFVGTLQSFYSREFSACRESPMGRSGQSIPVIRLV